VLKNFWYACEVAAAITAKPTKVRLLGDDLAIFRGADGAVIALADLCVHRGASLSGGWSKGNCLVCPYHGWEYAADGRCVKIPAAPPEAVIPSRAKIVTYPVVERYGLVWVFVGDLPEAERPPIPELPEHDEPGWRALRGEFLWKANYARVVENGVDIAHTPFVHRNSFGNPEAPQIDDHEVIADEWSCRATVTLSPPPPRGLWKLLRRKRTPVKATVTVMMPNLTRLELDLGAWKTVIIDSNVPVDAHTTRTLWVQYRNFFTGRWADRDARRRVVKIFREDQPTVESVRPELLPVDFSAELHLRSDAMGIAYRKLRRRFLERGWGVGEQAAPRRPTANLKVAR
jgi:phenylpropionate dioxygenase-like ring-hydroxylating dioxygenase large terminal subunit